MSRLPWLVALAAPWALGASEPPTWAHDIAPILYENCAECHRPGEVAPFSLLSYADAAKRAETIQKATARHAMPPWLPDGPEGTFLRERRLSEAQIALIGQWAQAGAPSGELKAAPPAPAANPGGWALGTPDLVVRMKAPFVVPAGPDDRYEVFPVPFSLAQVPAEVIAKAKLPDSEVLGIAAIEVKAGNPRVLHHADIWADTSGVAEKREADSGGNGFESFGAPGFAPVSWLGGKVPGMTPTRLPEGIAASVMPLSGDLVFQIHYRATGKPETDQSEVGIYFMREPVKRIVDSLLLRSFKLDIPAGEAAFTVSDSLTVPADCVLMNVFPHMHFVAREVHAEVEFPDGTRRSLIDISHWNFKWQDRYWYREPFVLPKGSVVRCRWVYDNSQANRNNPFTPPRDIHFGPNATDEMCALHLGVIPMNLEEIPLFAASRDEKMKEKIAELSPEARAKFRWDEDSER